MRFANLALIPLLAFTAGAHELAPEESGAPLEAEGAVETATDAAGARPTAAEPVGGEAAAAPGEAPGGTETAAVLEWDPLELRLDYQSGLRGVESPPEDQGQGREGQGPAPHAERATFDLIRNEPGIRSSSPAVELDFAALDPSAWSTAWPGELPAVPLLTGRAGFGLGALDLEALMGALAYEDGNTDVALLDGHVAGRYRFLGSGGRLVGSLVGGVRYALIDAELGEASQEVAGDVQIRGPFAGLRLQF